LKFDGHNLRKKVIKRIELGKRMEELIELILGRIDSSLD
jgi:hypothetical protein